MIIILKKMKVKLMDNKYLGIIIVLIAILAIGLYLFYENPMPQQQNIGNKSFTTPQGFKVVETTNISTKMTNHGDQAILLVSKEPDLDKATSNYKRINKDYNITTSDGKIGNYSIKVTNASKINNDGNESYIYKYWFEKDGTIYNLQSPKIDTLNKIAVGIIESIK